MKSLLVLKSLRISVAQWTRPQFRKRTLKLLGGGDAEEQLSAMSQLEVDVTEVVLDLVERCSFLADRQRRGPKRRKTAEIRHQPNHLERHYVDLDEPGIGEIYYEQRPARQQIGGNLVGDGQSTSDEEEEMDEDYYAQLEMERRRAEGKLVDAIVIAPSALGIPLHQLWPCWT